MRKYYSVFLVLCSLFIYSNAQAENFLEVMLAEAQEAEEKRINEAPKLAPTLIPQAKNQSQLGSYLVEQLRIKSKEEANKGKKAKKIKKDIKKIEKDLRKLNAGITDWEVGDYSGNLEKYLGKFKKHTTKYKNLIAPKLAEVEALMEVERVRLVAEAAERQKKWDAYAARCEGGSADDPFAVFAADTSSRTKLRIESNLQDVESLLLQTTEKNCLWEIEINKKYKEIALPKLLPEDSFQQNPNNKLQYIYTYLKPSGGNLGLNLVLDFGKLQCLTQSGTLKRPLKCVNPDSNAQAKTSSNNSSSGQTQEANDFLSKLEKSISLNDAGMYVVYAEKCADNYWMERADSEAFIKALDGMIERGISQNRISKQAVNKAVSGAETIVAMGGFTYEHKESCQMFTMLSRQIAQPEDRY